MAANGNLIFQDTNKATFVGANSNVVIDTVNASFGVGVDVNGPTSNLHVVGNAYVSSNLEVGTANLFVDTVNSRVGVGTTAPTDLLDVHYPNPSYGSLAGTEEGSLTVSAGAEHSNAVVYFRTPFDAAAPAKRAIFSDGGGYSGGASGGLHFCLESTNDNTTKVDLTDSKMTILQNGKVGIGITEPTEVLDIKPATSSDSAFIRVRSGSGGSNPVTESGLKLTESGEYGFQFAHSGATDLLKIRHQNSAGAVDRDDMMVWHPNGNVGIGTASPDYALDVNGATRVGEQLYVGPNNPNQTSPNTIYFGGLFGDSGYENCVIENRIWQTGTEKRELLLFSGNDTEGVSGSDRIRLRGNTILFDTYSSATTDRTGESVRMKIAQDGNVGIGTTDPKTKLHVNHDLHLQASSEAWSTTAGKGLYLRYSITGGQDGAYIQSTDRTNASLSYPLTFQGSKYDFAVGNVGIGTTNPNYAKLHVIGSTSYNITARYYNVNGDNGTVTMNRDLSGYFGSHLACAELQVFSDRRIKTEIEDIDDGSALELFRQIQPKTYKYLDKVERGNERVYGFVAQEIKELIPDAVDVSSGKIPNIYEVANVSNSNVITFTHFNTSNLESNSNIIEVQTVHGESHSLNITEVVDEHTIRVNEDLSEWIGSVDESGNVATGNELFVYGQEVNDFHHLKKSAIWTVTTAALQEVDRQQQADKVRISELHTELQTLKARLNALENAS